MPQFWYVPIEPLKARYTSQLGQRWIPQAFGELADKVWDYTVIAPPDVSEDIKTGSVLDGVNRGIVSLQQCSELVRRSGEMTKDDVIYLQDMWTPGIEALYYALSLRNVHPRIYAMCHAQSVDEYDFTYSMRHWMRPIELGLTRAFRGLFVGSTIHRDQLKAAGVECPIHVVGLPIDADEVLDHMRVGVPKKNQVVFSSRLNNEKNPYFMLDVAEAFLNDYPDWEWVVTTSAETFTSEVPGVKRALKELAAKQPRFVLREGLTKDEYYAVLQTSKIQFNSSLQDYVSWTLLEATLAGCDLCYPDFRSFPECVPEGRRYTAFDTSAALLTLDAIITSGPRTWRKPWEVCNMGLRVEMSIMLQNYRGPEVNVWHQTESYFRAVGLLEDNGR